MRVDFTVTVYACIFMNVRVDYKKASLQLQLRLL